MTGRVQIGQNLYRVPTYQLYGLDEKYEQVALVNMTFYNSSSVIVMSNYMCSCLIS